MAGARIIARSMRFLFLSIIAVSALAAVATSLPAQTDAQRPEPTRVTLVGSMTPAAALRELSEQSGIVIQSPEATADQIDLQINDWEFWRALDEVLHAARLKITDTLTNPPSVFVASLAPDELSPPRSYDGPFRVAAVRCRATRDLQNPLLNQLVVTLQVRWEPGLRPISLVCASERVRAECNGQEVAPAWPAGRIPAAIRRETPFVEFGFPLTLPPHSAEQIKLEGSLELWLPTDWHEFRFDNLASDPSSLELSKNDVLVALEQIQSIDGEYVVTVRYHIDDEEALDSFRSWPLENEALIDDDMGTLTPAKTANVIRQSDDEVAFEYVFDRDPTGLALVYRAPTKIQRIPVQFQLTDIELP